MRVISIDIETEMNEWHHLTPVSDLHLGAASCDVAAWRRLVKERSELPRHRWIGIGDLGDWILPRDPKRYAPGALDRALSGSDAVINDELELQKKMLEGVNFDLIGLGNHETAVINHHSVDVIDMLCKALGSRYGGYSGFLRYNMYYKGRNRQSVTLLYHHGAWGGRVVKGFGGMRDWARHYEGWDFCVAGHNHHSVVHKETRTAPGISATKERDVYMLFCGTHARNAAAQPGRARHTSYAEIRGYPPSAIGSPLISWRMVTTKTNTSKGLSVETRVQI